MEELEWTPADFDAVAAAQTHRENQAADVGSPLLVWEVANLFQGIDGTPYAHIFCIADPSRRKTVAQNALEAGNQYVRLPDAHAH